MEKAELVKICAVDSLPEKKGIRFVFDDEEIAIFKIDGKVFAVSNICPHNHSTVMYQGHLQKLTISFPIHGWEFDLSTGENIQGFHKIKTYKTEVINGEVFVTIPKKKISW
ncbi:MAG: nitrite reductase (NAD(P)H) small subunit [Ignavibacteria bacterium]|nr:nitrite reductase (NAD(P)H) small subunit [Ignavibacteria bacterium]